MKKKKEQDTLISRRSFLSFSVFTAGMAIIPRSFAMTEKENQNEILRKIPKLNPAFRVNVLNDGTVELYTNMGNGKTVTHQFIGLNSDLILGIEKRGTIKQIINDISKKYTFQKTECYREVKNGLDELENRQIIYYGKEMLVKIVEVGHAK